MGGGTSWPSFQSLTSQFNNWQGIPLAPLRKRRGEIPRYAWNGMSRVYSSAFAVWMIFANAAGWRIARSARDLRSSVTSAFLSALMRVE